MGSPGSHCWPCPYLHTHPQLPTLTSMAGLTSGFLPSCGPSTWGPHCTVFPVTMQLPHSLRGSASRTVLTPTLLLLEVLRFQMQRGRQTARCRFIVALEPGLVWPAPGSDGGGGSEVRGCEEGETGFRDPRIRPGVGAGTTTASPTQKC